MTSIPTDQLKHPRLLLVANRTCPCPALPDQVLEHLGRPAGEVLVVAPALNSRLRHWVSDIDDAVRAAEDRMRDTIAELRSRGLEVTGEVGDSDPLLAIADALHHFPATSIMISTWPAGASHWLEKNLPTRAAERFGLPVHHVTSSYDAPTLAASRHTEPAI
jgi:hypothetical protein